MAIDNRTDFSDDRYATSTFASISTPDIAVAPQGLSPEDRSAIEALPAGSALLIVLSGPNTGARYLLNSEVTTVGRSTRSDVFLDDVTVSRHHAQFVRSGGTFKVVDSTSLNGTYVNRTRVDEALLTSGDEIQIGKYRLTFYASPRMA